MSSDYNILIDKSAPILEIKKQLEKIVNSSFEVSENWEYYDLYCTEVMGLWIQFHDRDNRISRSYQREMPDSVDEFSQYTYHISIGFVGELIDPSDGKQWVRYAIVELARMINRNMECNCVVLKDFVVTHTFPVVKQ